MEQQRPLFFASIFYIFHRFWYRLTIFFHHWYIDGSYFFGRLILNIFMSLERTFAIRITISHFFEPLYQDYSVVGQIIGPIFRFGRLLVGGIFYFFFFIIFSIIYLAWLIIPFILLLGGFLTFLSRPT